MVNITHLNALFGVMITGLLDHYIYLFHKRQAILINLIKMSLMIKNIQFLKKYDKIWKKIEKLMKIILHQNCL